MQFIDIVIVALAILIVLCVVHYQIAKRKKEGGGCGGGCAHCQFGSQCPSHKEEEKKEE